MAVDSKTTTNWPIINGPGAIVPNLCPLPTVKQKRAIGYRSPKGESCLCMGALYTPHPLLPWTHKLQQQQQHKKNPSSTSSLITLLPSSIAT